MKISTVCFDLCFVLSMLARQRAVWLECFTCFVLSRLARQRAAIQEKSGTETVTVQQATSVNAAQLKAQLEQQLKQQRLALQQKRLLEAQGKIVSVTTNTPSLISATLNSAAGGTVIKTIGGTVGSSLLAGGTSILKTVQPKTLSALTGESQILKINQWMEWSSKHAVLSMKTISNV